MSNNSAKTFIHHKKITNPAGSDGFEYIVAPCRFFLRLLGAWPDPLENDNWSSTVRMLIVTTIMFLFATVSQTFKLFNCWDNLNAVAEILSNCNIPTSIAVVKIVNIWYHRHVTNLPQKIVTIQDRIDFMNKFTSFQARHNQLWRFSLALENAFNRMFLIQMVPCIFGLGTQGYQLISVIDS
uniref:Uncharacterized protein n=1 Tax=Trichogramma kaykai TaxID=54128 RepID=A0ABD2XAJ3_9HYME